MRTLALISLSFCSADLTDVFAVKKDVFAGFGLHFLLLSKERREAITSLMKTLKKLSLKEK